MKRIVPLLLAALLLALPLCACSSKGKTLLTLEKDGTTATVSVNLYELMLSRIKGSLAGSGVTSGGYAPTDPSFWNTVDKFGDSDKQQTLAEFYSAMILENCKTYVAAEWLFDTEGLTLSDAAVGDVDSRLKDLVSTYGTKTKLNAVLADYGVNYTMLRDAYLLEAKVSALQEHYFGKDGALIGENIKNQYVADHYVRIQQILLPLYRYKYVTDKNGDEIYYKKDSTLKRIAYDEDEALYVRRPDPNHPDDWVRDENDDVIWYISTNYTKIAYDTENGIRRYVLDKHGKAATKGPSAEQKKARRAEGEQVLAAMTGAAPQTFEAEMAKRNEYAAGEDQYTDGYYLNIDTDYAAAGDSFSYLSEITAQLKDAAIGTTVLAESADGIHIVRKYAPTEGAYGMEVNAPWFTAFSSALVEELFLEKCRALFDSITVDAEILASATDIRRIGANLYLY